MDKNTLSTYGWVVCALIILAIIITLATPFGTAIKKSITGSASGIKDEALDMMDQINKNTLPAPENICLSDGILSFDDVELANKYEVTVGSMSFKTYETSVDISDKLNIFVDKVSVVAINGSRRSPSATIELNLAPGLYQRNTIKLLKSWDELISGGVIDDNGTCNAVFERTEELKGDLIVSTNNSVVNLTYCNSLSRIAIPEGVTCATFGKCAPSYVRLPVSIGYFSDRNFGDCGSFTIIYDGTMEQWDAISFHDDWNAETGTITVRCADGEIVVACE